MSPLLKEYLNKKVAIITTDGHSIVGTLEGFDKSTNLFLTTVQNNYNDGDKHKDSNDTISIQICRGSEIVCCGVIPSDEDEKIKENLANVPQWTVVKTTKNIVKDEHLIWKELWAQKDKDK